MSRLLAFTVSLVGLGLLIAAGLVTHLSDVVPLATAGVGLAFVSIGAYLGVRARGNAIGWLMVLYGLLLETTTLLDAYVEAGLPDADWVAWYASWLWIPQIVALGVLLPLFFPDGALPGKKWRWVLFAAVLGWIGFGFGNAFTPELLDDYSLANPTNVELPAWLEGALQAIGFLGVLSAIGGGVTAAISRFRRSSGQLRQQMKWFVFAAALLASAFVLNGIQYETGDRQVGPILVVVASAFLAAAIAIAVLRYRLYDIDKIVSRTLVYAVLVVVLGGIFAVGVVAVPNLVIGESAPPLVVAATTLVIAALFNPLRKRVQRAVDRRFNRSKYDSERVIGQFMGTMQDETDAGAVVDGWVRVVSEVMEPASVGVWLR